MREAQGNSELLSAWRTGDQQAATILVRRYMVRLIALARVRMSTRLTRRVDPEDIVMSAWRSFFVRVDRGVFGSQQENDDLWPLLVTVTLRKLSRRYEEHLALRRSIDQEVSPPDNDPWQNFIAQNPTPDQAAMLTDELEFLFKKISPQSRQILERRLQGETASEIAKYCNCSERTVRRMLAEVRKEFLRQQPQSDMQIDEVDAALQHVQASKQLTQRCNIGEKSAAKQRLSARQGDRDFLLQRMIGQGGIGKVYRATRSSDGSLVAIKYLRKKFWQDTRVRQALLREYDITAAIQHPGIITLLGWGEARSGAVFLVMELLEQNLAQWIQHRKPDVTEKLQIMLSIADSLSFVHQLKIVHGDVTPGNVLLACDGVPKLADFGFARHRQKRGNDAHGGTPGFLAPEQLSSAFGSVSIATDVYGFGGLLYWLLAGHPPMVGDDVTETLADVLSSRVPDLLPVSQVESSQKVINQLNHLLQHCLRKVPGQRPSSMDEVRERLRTIADRLHSRAK